MTDVSHSSLPQDATPLSSPVSEDRRRPKAAAPYACLWAATLLCVVFALIAMFLQS